MKAHAVPQEIMSREFKLFGNFLSLREFLFIAGGLTVAYLFYFFIQQGMLPGLIAWPAALLFGLGGIMIGLVPIQDRSLDTWIMNYFAAIQRPTQRVWKKKGFDSANQQDASQGGVTVKDHVVATPNTKKKKVVGSTQKDNSQAPSKQALDQETEAKLEQEELKRLEEIERSLQEGDTGTSDSANQSPKQPTYDINKQSVNNSQQTNSQQNDQVPADQVPTDPPTQPIPTPQESNTADPGQIVQSNNSNQGDSGQSQSSNSNQPNQDPAHQSPSHNSQTDNHPTQSQTQSVQPQSTPPQSHHTPHQPQQTLPQTQQTATQNQPGQSQNQATQSQTQSQDQPMPAGNQPAQPSAQNKPSQSPSQPAQPSAQPQPGQAQSQPTQTSAQAQPTRPQPAQPSEQSQSQPEQSNTPSQITITDQNVDKFKTDLPGVDPKPNTINLVIRDQSGEYLPQVTCIIKNQNSEPVRAAVSNQLGQIINNVPLDNGTYQIQLTKQGYVFPIIQRVLTGKTYPGLEIRSL